MLTGAVWRDIQPRGGTFDAARQHPARPRRPNAEEDPRAALQGGGARDGAGCAAADVAERRVEAHQDARTREARAPPRPRARPLLVFGRASARTRRAVDRDAARRVDAATSE